MTALGYAEGTALAWEQLSQQRDAAEEQAELDREAAYARGARRTHTFTPERWLPGFCGHCGYAKRICEGTA